jgi:glycosyltransferase involved in cell wall biosynthesis
VSLVTSATDVGTAVPRVAVVIPCFDDGATLREAVASAVGDGGEPCQVVVVDDGSTDRATLAVLEELEDHGVTVIRQANAGPSAARNRGLAALTAHYVFPLDADDLLTPGSLTALASALDADPEAALAWGDEETFGSESFHSRAAESLDPWRITYLNEIPDALVRRDVLAEIGGWSKTPGYEDWDLWLGIAGRGYRGVYVPRVVCRYRRHGRRRLTGRSVRRHDEIMAAFRHRHAALFAERRRNWHRSTAPWRLKLALPLIEALPGLQAHTKQRAFHVAARPLELLAKRWQAALSGG